MRARHTVAGAAVALLGSVLVASAPAGAQQPQQAAVAAQADIVVAVAGDICGDSCAQTASLVTAMNPAAVLIPGDLAYEDGTLDEFNGDYDATWGAFKDKTYPVPGNHEYHTSGAAGYFDYFNGAGQSTGRAGERGKGYYSFNLGDWHIVALNSNISMTAGSTQEQWLRADLAANTKPCTAAYLHHPLYTRGSHSPSTATRPLWQALYDHKADLLFAGHDHNYVRYAPMKPDGTLDNTNGLREILVGTGGRGLYGFTNSSVNVQASNDNTHGVLKMTLSPTGYRADFVPIEGRTYTDTVSGTCHKAAQTPDFSLSASPAAVNVQPGASVTSTVSVGSLGGFSTPVTLGVSGLPAGVTGTFAANPVTPGSSSGLTLSASASAAPGTYALTVTGNAGGVTKTVSLTLTVGGTGPGVVFSDDFETSKGWTVNPNGTDQATSGRWERGDPESTSSSGAKQLGTTTSGVNCLVTGRLAGSNANSYDIDGGVTSVQSPAIALPSGTLRLTLRYNFVYSGSSSDYFRVKIVGSTTTTVVSRTASGGDIDGTWTSVTFDLSGHAGQNVRILVEAADAGGSSLAEGQVDDVKIERL